jgi:hypothetical protein
VSSECIRCPWWIESSATAGRSGWWGRSTKVARRCLLCGSRNFCNASSYSPWTQTVSSGKSCWLTFLWYDTDRIGNNASDSSMPGDLFTVLLPSNDRGSHTHRHRRPVLLFLLVVVAARTCLPSRYQQWKEGYTLPGHCLATIGRIHVQTQIDGRNLWSTPLRWAPLPWYTYEVSWRLGDSFRS